MDTECRFFHLEKIFFDHPYKRSAGETGARHSPVSSTECQVVSLLAHEGNVAAMATHHRAGFKVGSAFPLAEML